MVVVHEYGPAIRFYKLEALERRLGCFTLVLALLENLPWKERNIGGKIGHVTG